MEDAQQPQYYYDSLAHQWWVFNTAKDEWELCPENEQAGAPANSYADKQEQGPEQLQQQHQEHGAAAAAPYSEADQAAAGEAAAAAPHSIPAGGAEGAEPQNPPPANASLPGSACTRTIESPSPEKATRMSQTASSRSGRSVAGGVTFQVDNSDAGEQDRGSPSPNASPARVPLGSTDTPESGGSDDELGNALEKLMTTGFSRFRRSTRGEGSPSTSVRLSLGLGAGDDGSESNEDESSGDSSGENIPKPEPIVRRVTRVMTLKDDGGLSGCLQKVVALRQQLIDTEKGGQVPGAEDGQIKEEAWKIRARAAAKSAGTAARERAKSRWRSAAQELAAGYQQQGQKRGITPNAGAQRFADIVALVAAAKKKGMMHSSSLAESSAHSSAELSQEEAAAATAAAVQRVPSMWEGRRKSDMPGRIRFADATLRDPTCQQQVSGLFSTGRRHSAAQEKTVPLVPPPAPQQ